MRGLVEVLIPTQGFSARGQMREYLACILVQAGDQFTRSGKMLTDIRLVLVVFLLKLIETLFQTSVFMIPENRVR